MSVMVSGGGGTVDSQATKSIFEIRTHIVASIEAAVVLHLTASRIMIESKYLLSCGYHKVRKIGKYH
jgi:hypothetical protein